jgi:uncharacterized RDD family membrane protein YckC
MLQDQLYTVGTPEHIDVAYDVAGIGSRFLAALIDHLIIAVVLSLSCFALALASDQFNLGLDGILVLSLFGLGIYLSLCGYYIFFETIWNGQTPGKRLFGLRMVRVGGRPLGFVGSAVRNFIRLADFLPALYGLGLIVMFIDRRARRLGDMAAGCIAVRERGVVTLASLDAPASLDQPAVPAAAQVAIPNLRVLRREDYDLVQEYLRRRSSLSAEARHRLSLQLVEGLSQRLGYPIHLRQPGDADLFLYQVAAEYQALQRQAAPGAS